MRQKKLELDQEKLKLQHLKVCCPHLYLNLQRKIAAEGTSSIVNYHCPAACCLQRGHNHCLTELIFFINDQKKSVRDKWLLQDSTSHRTESPQQYTLLSDQEQTRALQLSIHRCVHARTHTQSIVCHCL